MYLELLTEKGKHPNLGRAWSRRHCFLRVNQEVGAKPQYKQSLPEWKKLFLTRDFYWIGGCSFCWGKKCLFTSKMGEDELKPAEGVVLGRSPLSGPIGQDRVRLLQIVWYVCYWDSDPQTFWAQQRRWGGGGHDVSCVSQMDHRLECMGASGRLQSVCQDSGLGTRSRCSEWRSISSSIHWVCWGNCAYYLIREPCLTDSHFTRLGFQFRCYARKWIDILFFFFFLFCLTYINLPLCHSAFRVF